MGYKPTFHRSISSSSAVDLDPKLRLGLLCTGLDFAARGSLPDIDRAKIAGYVLADFKAQGFAGAQRAATSVELQSPS